MSTKKILNYIDGSMDIVKGVFKIAAIAAPTAAPMLLAVAGVATYIQAFLKLIPDNEKSEVDKKLEELEKEIDDLEKKMNAQFADLKSFVTEIEFTIEILNETSSLIRFIKDIIKHRSPESIQQFRQAYDKNDPLLLSYNLMSLLDQKSTNPLRMDMDKEQVKKKATFEKWENIIIGALGQLMIIEAFASGLFKKKNPFNWKRIMEKVKSASALFKMLRTKYEKDEHYWDEVKTFFEKYINDLSHMKLTNAEKAKEIAAKLDSYLTRREF
ncbi:unnamed protein product [Caenorhabditis brenneri]